MSRARPFRLAVELSGAGVHPAAWRLPHADAGQVFTAPYWVRLVRHAERAGATLVVLDDTSAPVREQPGTLVGGLDAVGVASLLGPVTTRTGLAPVVPVTYLEPFHVGKAVQTIDHVSLGRGAVQVAVAAPAGTAGADDEARRYDERTPRDVEAAWREADDVLEVVTRLWDSWEDDAIVLDEAADRYIDRDKVHAIEFSGEFFSVHGASITPRSPQGRPVVVLRGDDPHALALAARRADVIRVAVDDRTTARVDAVRAAVADAGRDPSTVTVLVDADVLLGAVDSEAGARLRALDDLTRRPAAVIELVGGVLGVADGIVDLVARTGADGVTVRSLAHATDLPLLADGVAPLLRDRGLLVEPGPTGTLRDTLGLARPASRYATTR
jgi:alkanesulfonate monooxygenase SsuD/methylene tetrahydromethanopterin reductase-like flavin-dependent oxidoreductase (luciferase family)